MKLLLSLLFMTLFSGHILAQIEILYDSFEDTINNMPNTLGWNTTCFNISSINDSPTGGGNWSMKSPVGQTQGCFYQYIYQSIPNVQQGDILQVSGWCKTNANTGVPNHGIGFGIKNSSWFPSSNSISNMTYANSTSWVQLTATDTFNLSSGDTAVIILNPGLVGGAGFGTSYFDLIRVIKLGNTNNCNLTIDNSITINDSSLMANENNAFYQWLDCDNNFAILPGEFNQAFIAPSNGSFAAIISKAGCIDTSQCFNVISYLGTENLENSQLSVFPNPTNGLINIELEDFKNASLRVIDTHGHLVYKTNNINSNVYQFELNTGPGFYFIEINTDGILQKLKLVKY